MKVIITALLLISIISASYGKHSESEYLRLFEEFLVKYGKNYHNYESDQEFDYRFDLFKQNLDLIELHNSDEENTYTLGMNQFGDWSNEEFREYAGDAKPLKNWIPSDDFDETTYLKMPSDWDWRTYGAVTPIESQGQCGGSPYFAATVAIEGCHKLSTGDLVVLSNQNLIDCPGDTGNLGCNGGYMTASFEVVMSERGIDANYCYPYTGEDGNCSFNPNPPCCASTIGSYVNVTTTELALQQAVLIAPVATALNAELTSFQFYQGGIYSDRNCSNSTEDTDHGIAVIGYGINTDGIEYWILKNSFGTSWGVEGYMLLRRNFNNLCGVANFPSYALDCQKCSNIPEE